jgi:hypothetical protein
MSAGGGLVLDFVTFFLGSISCNKSKFIIFKEPYRSTRNSNRQSYLKICII